MKAPGKLRRWLAVGLGLIAALGATTAAVARQDGERRGTTTLWANHLRTVDVALSRHDVPRALSAWREAHAAALGSGGWEGMLQVGHAYLRIGDVADFKRAFVPSAREHYLAALLRARHAGSLDGVLSAAEAFAALGDLGVVRQAMSIAEPLMARPADRRTAERLCALSRWTRDGMLAAVQPH